MTSARQEMETVVERMRELERDLPAGDGVAQFNALYLDVTEGVLGAAIEDRFESPRFLARLDVVFAELYFDAVETDRLGRRPSSAWAPLFDARARRDVAPIQFALAGMNAHINHDLPLALVATCGELGVSLRRGGAEHRDYERVNSLLAESEARVRRRFATGLLELADRALGNLDTVLAMWKIERARDHAWTAGETLERLAATSFLRQRYLDSLASMVGFAGRGLLAPTLAA